MYKMIIPSIDLMNGKAVQLKQGCEKVLEADKNPVELAKYYARFGDVAVIDLDAAMNKGDNEEVIKAICHALPYGTVRVGGGIRDAEKARRIISYGAKKIIIGTAANEDFLSKLPKDKVIVSIDTKNGKIAIDGWKNTVEATVEDYIKRFDNLCSGYLYTVVEKEGMMQGCDIENIKKVRNLTKLDLTAAGGISTIDEIVNLQRLNINTQLGMCIYTKTVNLEDAFIATLDFEKQNGLIPTIVQDYQTKQVLMLAYSNKEAVKTALSQGVGAYYSRSRDELWVKGKTSGNEQELLTARFDCDFDTLLYTVKQKGIACHLNRFSCFGDKNFNLQDLYNLLLDRKEKMPEKSFTTKLFKDRNFLNSKILEEAKEVSDFENGEDPLSWEVADLTYFVLALMAQNNVKIENVLGELASRTK